MKNRFSSSTLSLILCIFCIPGSMAQAFLAGQHEAGNYFVDVNPDTTMTGPYYHAIPEPPATYTFDINGDRISDFYLSAKGFWFNGSGDRSHSLREIAKSLRKNDAVNRDLEWSTNSSLRLTYTDWVINASNCKHNGFVTDSAGNYIAVRMCRPGDTVYGWIKA